MTERLADISARIDGVRELGAVVYAMKGIAAARAHTARAQVLAVDSYAQTIAAAMAQVLRDDAPPPPDEDHDSNRLGLLVFGAEQGFAGAFTERVLDSLADQFGTPDQPGTPDQLGTKTRPLAAAEPTSPTLFLIGTRALSIAMARDLLVSWSAALPSHTPGIPKLADQISTAIYRAVADGHITRLDVVFTGWQTGRPSLIKHRLFPVDLTTLPAASGPRPLTQMPPKDLLAALGQDYFHAQVCKAALHAFAAENEARMEAMTAASSQIARELESFQATLRRVRQEAITAEIIELGTGVAAAQDTPSATSAAPAA